MNEHLTLLGKELGKAGTSLARYLQIRRFLSLKKSNLQLDCPRLLRALQQTMMRSGHPLKMT
jgi:hypothetical protein